MYTIIQNHHNTIMFLSYIYYMNRRKYIATVGGISGVGITSRYLSRDSKASIVNFDINNEFSSVLKDDLKYVYLIIDNLTVKFENVDIKEDIDVTLEAKFQQDKDYNSIYNNSISIDKNGIIDLSKDITSIELFNSERLDMEKFNENDTKNIDINLIIDHNNISEINKVSTFTISTNNETEWSDNFDNIDTKEDYVTTQMDGSNNGSWVFGIESDDASNIDDYYTNVASPEQTAYIRSDDSNDRYILTVKPENISISNSVTIRSEYLGSGDDDTSGIHIYDEENGVYWMAGITNDAGFDGIQVYDEVNDTRTKKSDLRNELSNSSQNVYNRQEFELIYNDIDEKLIFYINGDIASEYSLQNDENIVPSSGGLVVKYQDKTDTKERNPGSALFNNIEIINRNIFGEPRISNVKITDSWQTEPTNLDKLADNNIETGVTDGSQYDQDNDTNEFDGGDIHIEYMEPINVNEIEYDLDFTYHHESSWSRHRTSIIVSNDTDTEEIFYNEYTSGTTETTTLNQSGTSNVNLDNITEVILQLTINGGGLSSQSIELNINFASISLPEYESIE